nr:uncharacterized protein LOC113817745 [Penaeus vannamei]
MRDMSVDLTRDSSPVSSLTSTPLKQDALKEAQGKEEEGGGQWAHGSLPAASLTPLEGSAVSNHKHGVRRHHQLVSYTSLPFDGAGGGRLGGGIGSLALDPTFSPASLLCVPVACPGKETLAVLACLVDKTSEMEFDQEDVLTVQECFKYTIGMLVNTLTAEREHRLRTQCQALLNVAQNLFTHLDDVTVLLREVMAEARKLTDAERCSSSSWTRTTISWCQGLRWREEGGVRRRGQTAAVPGHRRSRGYDGPPPQHQGRLCPSSLLQGIRRVHGIQDQEHLVLPDQGGWRGPGRGRAVQQDDGSPLHPLRRGTGHRLQHLLRDLHQQLPAVQEGLRHPSPLEALQ